MAHRTLPAQVLTAAMDRAVEANMLNPEVVPIGALDRYDRPVPSLRGYDDLLSRRALP